MVSVDHSWQWRVFTLLDIGAAVTGQKVVVCGSVEARAWSSFVVCSWVLIFVAASWADVDELFSGTEGCRIDGAGVSFVLGEREVGDLTSDVSHICHRTSCQSSGGRSQKKCDGELHHEDEMVEV